MIRPPMTARDPVQFDTRAEAEQWIETVLGEWAGDFDITEICSEVFEFDQSMDPATFEVRLDRQCFRLAVTDEEFWETVRACETSQTD